MPYNPYVHNRRSIRLSGFENASPGAYFVTCVTQERESLLGEVVGGRMRPSPAGQMIVGWWRALTPKFDVRLDSFVLMPNHVHGIVEILDHRSDGAIASAQRGDTASGGHTGPALQSPRSATASLPAIVQWFKTMTTNDYIRGVNEKEWQPFQKRLWQRNYNEHIVRNNEELASIRRYIRDNPRFWSNDEENLTACRGGPTCPRDSPTGARCR